MIADAELVRRTIRGDRNAFGLLISRYERVVLATAYAELRDLHSAEDVSQASLLLAFQKLTTLLEPAHFGAWLLQITRRQVVEFIRRRRDAVLTIPDGKLIESDSESDDFWIEYEHLLTLMKQLTEDEQLVIGLRHFEGFSMAQIAEATGRPLGSVTKQISRAKARLRELWDED